MNVFDITEIEDTVAEALSGLKLGCKIYRNRPKSGPQAESFVVTKVSGGVEDYGTYGECTVCVYLFARNAGNVKNGKLLSAMYRKVIEGLPAVSGRLLFGNMPSVVGDTEDDFGFTCRIVSVKTTVKVNQ
jgi:hypothetical protein